MLASPADMKSTIDYINPKSLKAKVLNVIDSYKIFPIYQILKQIRKKKREKMLNFEIID